MKRVAGFLLLALGTFLGIGMVATLAETSVPADALPFALVTMVFSGGGIATLRSVERPIFGTGPARRVVSTIFLVIATLFATMFVAMLGEGVGGSFPLGDAVIPLYLSLAFGGYGLGVRGISTSGSFAGNLTIVGVGAMVALLLLVLFVVSVSGEDGSLPADVLFLTAMLMLASAGAVWFWSRRAVAPMAEITAVANEIQGGSLDRRIGLRTGTREVQQLAESFDHMLDRLAQASNTQQRMIEDASHELRTPLAALAVNNEVALNATDPTSEDYRRVIEKNQRLVERLESTIEELLSGGRAASHHLQRVDNDLMAIVTRVADQHRVVSPGVPIVVRGPHELRLGIDGPSVQRALENLVENATRYSPPGLPVEITVTPGEIENLLSVTDHGLGIDSENLDDIFDRYYQGASENGGTAGIGLALVKQVAEAHGDIDVTSPISDEGGTRFTLVFRGGD